MIWHRIFYNFFGTEIHKRLGAIRKRLGDIHKKLGAIYKRFGAIYKKLGAIYKKLGAKILAPKLYTPALPYFSQLHATWWWSYSEVAWIEVKPK